MTSIPTKPLSQSNSLPLLVEGGGEVRQELIEIHSRVNTSSKKMVGQFPDMCLKWTILTFELIYKS
jgi:hypothetical protein